MLISGLMVLCMSNIAKADGYEYTVSGHTCGQSYNIVIHSVIHLTQFEIHYLIAQTLGCPFNASDYDDSEEMMSYEMATCYFCFLNGIYHIYLYCDGESAEHPCPCEEKADDI